MEHSLFIGGKWLDGRGEPFKSIDPASDELIWPGKASSQQDIDAAVESARKALPGWAGLPVDRRIEVVNSFAGQLAAARAELAEAISRETGKPLWESLGEVDSMKGKVAASIEAFRERRQPITRSIGAARGVVRYRPHGVVAVLGPYNFPGHLPNGHIVPALLAGNTVVFKPSELTPAAGQRTVELWQRAGLPDGVIDLVQGARDVGEALIRHHGIDGVFFTGSLAAGRTIHRALADQPGKIIALEMGGNNPLVVDHISDPAAAGQMIVQSAFITTGQRCSCARRLIVVGDGFDQIVREITGLIERMIIGPYTLRPEPFMGPLISAGAAKQILNAQEKLESVGATPIVRARRMDQSRAFLTPGLIDVTNIQDRPDEEIFGPLLEVMRVGSFDEAIAECNRTCYGLAAGLLSDDRTLFDRFVQDVRAGVINFNRPLTGASGLLPFGGVGCSGNHRPSAYFACDYCSYPVASLESERIAPVINVGFK